MHRTFKGSHEELEVKLNKALEAQNEAGFRVVATSLAGSHPDMLVALVTYEKIVTE